MDVVSEHLGAKFGGSDISSDLDKVIYLDSDDSSSSTSSDTPGSLLEFVSEENVYSDTPPFGFQRSVSVLSHRSGSSRSGRSASPTPEGAPDRKRRRKGPVDKNPPIRGISWTFWGIRQDITDPGDLQKLLDFCVATNQRMGLAPEFERGIFQVERAPTTGNLHLQGWTGFSRPIRFRAGIDLLEGCGLGGVSGERPHKAPLANWRYCSKEDTRCYGPWNFGIEPAGQGKRNDLASATAAFVESSYDLTLLALEYPTIYIRYAKGFSALRDRLWKRPPIKPSPEVRVYWGVAGSGKSHRARVELPYAQPWTEPTNGSLYAANYTEGNGDHIFEDFSGWAKFRWLLAFLDGYPISVNTCGAMVPCTRDRVIITSQYHPREWYRELEAKYPGKVWPALRRRLTKILYFGYEWGSHPLMPPRKRRCTADIEEIADY